MAGFGFSLNVKGVHRNIRIGEIRERGAGRDDVTGLRASSKLQGQDVADCERDVSAFAFRGAMLDEGTTSDTYSFKNLL